MDEFSLVRMIRRPFRPFKRFYYQIKNRQKAINHFKKHLRPTDVFLVGHPKSGNTWLALMLGVVIQKNFNNNISLANVKSFIPYITGMEEKISSYEHIPNPRIFRNEGPFYPELYPKTIYIVRDPRSVYVSYFQHFMHDKHVLGKGKDCNIENFVDELLTYGCIKSVEPYLTRWDKQVSQWIKLSKRQPVKIVKYEDMKKDRRKVLEDVVEFMGVKCEKMDIDLAVERGSFNSMRGEEQTEGAEPYSGSKGEKGFFYVRKGKVDGWKDELSPEIVKRIENKFSKSMKKIGYI